MRPEVSVGKVEWGSLGLGDPPGRGLASGGAFVSSLHLKIPTAASSFSSPLLLHHLPVQAKQEEKRRDIWFV